MLYKCQAGRSLQCYLDYANTCIAGMDELQHRRALSVGDSVASAALGSAAQDKNPTQGERLMETSLDLLLVMAYGDSVVKSVMCSRDNLQHLLDLLQRLQQPGQLLKVKRDWVDCGD